LTTDHAEQPPGSLSEGSYPPEGGRGGLGGKDSPQTGGRRGVITRGLALLAACALVFGLTGCTNNSFTRLGFPNPITEQGKTVLTLWQGSWIAGLAVGAVIWGMILWAVVFHRKKGDRLPQQVRYNMPIEILCTTVPFVLIAVLFYFTAKDENYIDQLKPNPQVTVDVLGLQWSWKKKEK